MHLNFGLMILAWLVILNGDVPSRIYPCPDDVPAAPAGSVSPGGVNLPVMSSEPDGSNTIYISEAADMTYPGEVLAVTGEGLAYGDLRIWSEGKTAFLHSVSSGHILARRDQMMLVKLDSANVAKSVMLVWPSVNAVSGRPIRLNAPEIQWTFPSQIERLYSDRKLILFGRNFQTGSYIPKVYFRKADGSESGELAISSTNAYRIEVTLPDNLTGGTDYDIWVHNGSGGIYGWSNPQRITLYAGSKTTIGAVFNVTNYGATVNNSGNDDAIGIMNAVAAAAAYAATTNVRAKVYFPQGAYHISQPIAVNADNITLEGEIRPGWSLDDWDTNSAHTVIYPKSGFSGSNHPPIISLEGSGNVIRELGIEAKNSGVGKESCVKIKGKNALIESVTMKLEDNRPSNYWGGVVASYSVSADASFSNDLDLITTARANAMDQGAVEIVTGPAGNTVIRSSAIHTAAGGIKIGGIDLYDGHAGTVEPTNTATHVLVEDVMVTGYYTGCPQIPGGKAYEAYFYESGRQNGVAVNDGKCVSITDSLFRGYDRFNAATPRILNRTVEIHGTHCEKIYCADNISTNMGTAGKIMCYSQGEQYLTHFAYPHGGVFDATSATVTTVTFPTNGIPVEDTDVTHGYDFTNNAGSRVLAGVGANDNWRVYIGRGKGIGQVRKVTGKSVNGSLVTLTIDKAWRVVPDSTSKIILSALNSDITLYRNVVDSGCTGPGLYNSRMIDAHRNAGIQMWYAVYHNIIDGNDIRNMGGGMTINSLYRSPKLWITIRNNYIKNMWSEYFGLARLGSPGINCDVRTQTGAGYKLPPADADKYFYEAGTAIRSNVISDVEIGIQVNTYYDSKVYSTPFTNTEDHVDAKTNLIGGMLMTVVEGNTISGINRLTNNIVVSGPAAMLVIHTNRLDVAKNAVGQFYTNDIFDIKIIGNY